MPVAARLARDCRPAFRSGAKAHYDGPMLKQPKAILFDLDDTLISAYADPGPVWQALLADHAEALAPHDPGELTRHVGAYAAEFWSDPARHKTWRLKLYEARREIIRGAFEKMNILDQDPRLTAIAHDIADRYSARRDEAMALFPESHALLDHLKSKGIKLALITNGEGAMQRAKVERFELTHRFDHIQIEGEVGFGKPEEEAYWHAMDTLETAPEETWMVGDNYEWEVVAPAALGLTTIWHNSHKAAPPEGKPAPHHTLDDLSGFWPLLEKTGLA